MRKTAKPRPTPLGALPDKNREDQCSSKQRDTSNTELCTVRRKLPLVLHGGVNFMDESGSFHREAPMLARHATDQKKIVWLGWIGLPFPLLLFLSPSSVPLLSFHNRLSRCLHQNTFWRPWMGSSAAAAPARPLLARRHKPPHPRERGAQHEPGEVQNLFTVVTLKRIVLLGFVVSVTVFALWVPWRASMH